MGSQQGRQVARRGVMVPSSFGLQTVKQREGDSADRKVAVGEAH